MAKFTVFFLAIFLSGVIAHGQIIVTQPAGFSNSIGGNYSLSSTSPSSFVADAGTNVYRDASGTIAGFYRYVFRQNNKWKIGAYYASTPAQSILAETEGVSTKVNPPCNAYWKDMVNGAVFQVLISGNSCTDELTPGSYFEALPQYVQLPTAVTTVINQLLAPKNGMMVYDLTAHCVKVYSNGQWKCLSFQ